MALLPDAAAAATDPEAAATALGALVKQSLDESWRADNSDAGTLEGLAGLAELHLASMREKDELEPCWHEAACTACLKLARNLCVGSPSVQQFWWQRGLAQRLVARAREDLALTVARTPAWREALPSFLANSVAANDQLREPMLDLLFPYGLVAVTAQCVHRPELVFMLVQNLFPSGRERRAGEANASIERLVSRQDGHCVLFYLLACVRAIDDMEQGRAEAMAREWASVLFHSLWLSGGFPTAYRGVKQLTSDRWIAFLCEVAGAAKPQAAVIVLTHFVKHKIGRAEALGLLWHTIHGLIDGPCGAEHGGGETARGLVRSLFADDGFVALAAEEMAESLSLASAEWGLEWHPEAVPAEACAALGVEAEDLDACALAAAAAASLAWADDGEAAESEAQREDDASEGRRSEGGLFYELTQAALKLTAAPDTAEVKLPARLIGVYLTANVALVDALHRLRFGGEEDLAKRKAPSEQATKASQACLLVDQLQLFGNLLYERRHAQEFARLSGGLRVLLCHCYADPELPLLREAGIFAVRNATLGNEANQCLVRELLAQQRFAAAASKAEPPACVELGF